MLHKSNKEINRYLQYLYIEAEWTTGLIFAILSSDNYNHYLTTNYILYTFQMYIQSVCHE